MEPIRHANGRVYKVKGVCSVEGCGAIHSARGFCGKHYQRWRNNGDPLKLLKAPNGEGKPRDERAYYAANREKLRAANDAYRLKNPGKVKARQKAYVAENKPQIAARQAIYRASKRDKAKAASAAWRAANPERAKAAVADWYARHPDAMVIKKQNRAARKRAQGGRLSRGLRDRLLVLQRWKCINCHADLRQTKSHLDHRIPIAKGGVHEDENMQLLCPSCNSSKGAKDPITWAQSHGRLL